MDSRKNKIIVLYKKYCGFCVACKNFSEKRSSKNNLKFVDIYSDKAAEIFDKNNMEKDYSTIWVFNNDSVFSKSKAVFIITQNLTLPWKILSYGYFLLPEGWWNFLYDFIAKKLDKNICTTK